ncbi:MAG: ABC transporter permease [Bacteroidota bacterium]
MAVRLKRSGVGHVLLPGIKLITLRLIVSLIKILFKAILVLFGVVTLVFWMFQGLGDPERMLMGQTTDSLTRSRIRTELHLDMPAWKQYLFYLNDLSPIAVHSKKEIEENGLTGIFIGEEKKLSFKLPYLRVSYQSKKEVGSIFAEALPGTMILAFSAIFFATIIGVFLGTLAAVKKDSWLDFGAVFSSILGISAPSFFVALLFAWVFGFLLSDYTGLQMTGSWFEYNPETGKKVLTLHHLILPALTLGIRPLAFITQLTRIAMLDVLHQDLIRTARAKGLAFKMIILRHALRNATNPVLTAVSGWLAELLAGSFFVESIFGWKGIGKVTVDALDKLDYPIVMGGVLISACFFVLVSGITDFLYKRLDPRIKE